MDFLRLLSDDLQSLRSETKKKYPVVKDAVDKALETLPYLQKQYAALLRADGPPGPGHPLFKSESVLRPFLLACNHTNASHKIVILALVSIQRLVSWDAIEQSSVGSILRVLQIQAEKNTHVDVQVKLLQTLLQLVTLGFQDTASTASTATARTNSSSNLDSEAPTENALVGSEDLVMQAIWICIHLHGGSSSASSVVGNTAAMTIRQVVSLAFGKVQTSPEAKRVGVLVFQELCFMSREESGVWLKRSATSPMSVALGVELLETILAGHSALFRDDAEFYSVLKQHICSLIQYALETGCAAAESKHSTSITASALQSLSSNSSGSSNNSSGIGAPFFPLLVRAMRLASVVLCTFSDILPEECTVVLRSVLEIVSTGAYYQPGSAKSPSHAKLTAHEAKSFISHHSSGSSGFSSNSGSSNAQAMSTSYVTWPVLLALEVLNRVSLEATMVVAISNYGEPMLQLVTRTVSSVVTTSPPSDFRLQGADVVATPRSGLEFLNDQDAPPLQPFFTAIRVAVTCESNLIASIFDLSRLIGEDAAQSDMLARQCVNVLAPYCLQTFTHTMRHCREVELIQLSLKSYHVLATIASRLRANLSSAAATARSADPQASSNWDASSRKMDEVTLACMRALCAFSFPLPESVRGRPGSSTNGPSSSGSNASSSGSGGMNEYGDNDAANGGEESESCLITLTWREVHAMKALFSAAHIMEEEMVEGEWCTLLEAFEIIVGLTDSKLKGGQNKIPTKNYRIGAFRVEDEDVEQQLVMLSNSIVELFRDALKLSSSALRRLTAALRKVCWDQLGLPPHHAPTTTSATTSPAASSDSQPPQRRPSGNGLAAIATRATAAVSSASEIDLPTLSASHQIKTYQNFLGVGLTGSGTYLPSFAFRMLTQLATNSKRCFEDVTHELLVMVVYSLPAPATASQFPQLYQFQVVATDSILQLMQRALQNVINSLSPTAKLPNDATLEQMEAHARQFDKTSPHVFDQQELFKPLLQLMRSDLKDRVLVGMLDLLNGCGHLINVGWPLILQSVQEACEIGDAKTQLAAFKCLRVIVDDLLVSIPRMYLRHCVTCIGRFASCAKDVNISLTAVNELWSVADIIGKHKSSKTAAATTTSTVETEAATSRAAPSSSYWACAFAELMQVALDDRTEVRNCAINTLFGTGVTYGVQFDLAEWRLFLDETVLPLAAKLHQGRGAMLSDVAAKAITLHHSRDSAQKQWDESRVLMLTGISRVLQTNCNVLLSHAAWFHGVWRELLRHVALNSESAMAKEVVLAAVLTLQTLLQVSSLSDFDQIAQSQPVRAGAGMRVVGGALVSTAAATPTSAGTAKRSATAHAVRDPALWEGAFSQLLALCDARATAAKKQTDRWKEEDEQEIASAVVSVVVTLYSQAKEFEFKDERNVVRLLSLLETLVLRHVLAQDVDAKIANNVTTNSLQSRVLNAFEECGSFAAHPAVHEQALDQLVRYVQLAAARDLVFFTRHALMSLAKLYASVSHEARRDRFEAVLASVQPFLRATATAASPEKKTQGSAAQKAASQLWKHALRVLLVLISHGLAAVRLVKGEWRYLLETISTFLSPSSGRLPLFAQGEEDEALVLSVLECLVDSVIALFAGGVGAQLLAQASDQYQQFSDALLALLCSGVDGARDQESKPLLKCCVRQLATLSIQREDERLALLACTYLVRCCDAALRAFAEVEDASRDAAASARPSEDAVAAARDRVIILLTSTCEVGLNPRSVLEMFPALCTCITSGDLEVRRLLQRLLVQARLAEFCLDVLDVHEVSVAARSNSGRSSNSGSTKSGNWTTYA